MNLAEVTIKDAPQQTGPLKGKCCAQPGDLLKGTFFFGGAGLDGPYISKIIIALRDIGIKSAIYMDRDKWSGGIALDAAVGAYIGGLEYDPNYPMLIRNYSSNHPQLNLIGYSYGSVISAQLAMKYAAGGTHVDHLVLIGSPIRQGFLEALKTQPFIRNLIIIDLDEHGDPIYAGMSSVELVANAPLLVWQMTQESGHFYYSAGGEEGDSRRRLLAAYLFQRGLR